VSAPVQRLGALTLYTSRTGQIDLNGSLWVNHGKNGLEIETGTLNVLQPIFANHFKVTALEVNIEAPIDSPGWGIFQTYAINIAAPVTIAGQTVQPVQEPAEKRSAVTGKVMERAATTLISESDRALLPVYTFFPEMRRGPRRPDEQ
jgi:hypothetical protein